MKGVNCEAYVCRLKSEKAHVPYTISNRSKLFNCVIL